MRKPKINYNPPRSFNYRSNYRDGTVLKSVKNYDDKVIDALTTIYKNPGLTLYDFERPFIAKLLSDDLVEARNIPLFHLSRYHLRPQTSLYLTERGCKRIDRPYKP